ncbi:hypothetical protein [Halorientalis salina]|uniref:hypothetical protein n=1 Tax=Halorientalis salina TaxID=2932266 RepID=UPI0010AC338D|nr:hypothetical protein [Halorientalis salina]
MDNGRVDVLTTVDLGLPDESDRRPEEATVSLAVDSTADEWTKEWEDDTRLSGTLTAEMGEGDTVSITSQTAFESGGSVQTTRYEEIHHEE